MRFSQKPFMLTVIKQVAKVEHFKHVRQQAFKDNLFTNPNQFVLLKHF